MGQKRKPYGIVLRDNGRLQTVVGTATPREFQDVRQAYEGESVIYTQHDPTSSEIATLRRLNRRSLALHSVQKTLEGLTRKVIA